MYPHSLFSLVPPFPRTSRVFVAISFDSQFDRRWNEVLVPAIASLRRNDHEPLEAFRVNLSQVSDAILTEILTGIANSHCVVADITASHELDSRPIRNANVLYEVGLAHAVRLPEEVVLFRSDSLRLDFDIAGVRVHHYSPDDDPSTARDFVADTISASLSALQSRRRASLKAAAEQLTLPAAFVLLEAINTDAIKHPVIRNLGQLIGSMERSEAISHLLQIGAIKAVMTRLTPEVLKEKANESSDLLTYVPTPLGRALLEVLADEMGAFQPEMREYIDAILASDGDGAA
jgi:hypothetical protein